MMNVQHNGNRASAMNCKISTSVGWAALLLFLLAPPASAQPVSQLTSFYPLGAVPITASATGTTAATTATLAANTTARTWICGFYIGSTATAAAAGNATITGTITGTMNFEMGSGVSPAVVVTTQAFSPCVPSSGVNQAIAVVSAAPGTGGVISVTAWGYQVD